MDRCPGCNRILLNRERSSDRFTFTMTIHKPSIFYLVGLFTGLLAVKLGGWVGLTVFFASMPFAVWLDVRTKQTGGWH